ncbi:MAG TPA: DUF5107 domain-containing protein [Candidatus Didemnitutus sp.]|nr:DUF5107 domain-containing protein [Candidatus Didemnitutus sp.]
MPTPSPVQVRREPVVLPTYEPLPPDRNPMFLEKRVYQGSSGRVYPLPCTDRIAEHARPRTWEAVFIENDYLLVMMLPALGGRIHRAMDKTNGYDFIYYQPVIKPALVGLAGPWASGGIEFNWPQHHRPSTFMPVDVAVEHHEGGSATVWLSEHDPMGRMKGMHGVRLHPDKSYLELVARVYNRTPDVQTFLWWANVATRVHEQYQSFFPGDVTHVADHAKRATSEFPRCRGRYYGIDYGRRQRDGVAAAEQPRQYRPAQKSGRQGAPGTGYDYPADDLSWYANIPVPTSYMCMGSQADFAGGYDYRAHAGIVQIANHHISPGKKQWTWGNHEFGYAWDRNLTDPDENGEYRPYIELMAGVYTDNQPDFSFLQPGETRTWSQYWYPLRAIGPAQVATLDAAGSLRVSRGIAHIGVATTSEVKDAVVELRQDARVIGTWKQTIAPDRPLAFETLVDAHAAARDFSLVVRGADGRNLLSVEERPSANVPPPPPATEPAAPGAVRSNDELYVIGLHLEQYRHATRLPETYWREGLRRDPGDSRCHLALGRWHLRRGELDAAETHLRASLARLTSRNPNPADGEPSYQLGLCLQQQALRRSDDSVRLRDEAYAAFYKATWNHAWQPAAFHALAEIDVQRGDLVAARDHLNRALRVNADNLRARNLLVMVLRETGSLDEAERLVAESLALDPADWWSRHLRGDALTCDDQIRLDLAVDHIRAGLYEQALEILVRRPPPVPATRRNRRAPGIDLPNASLGAKPMLHYCSAWICARLHRDVDERRHLRIARRANPDYCFPARVEEIAFLEHAIAADAQDARAPFLLGNLLYDRRRHREAIDCWKRAVRLEPANAVAWRNLGIGSYNILGQPRAALHAYERAVRSAPQDARLLFERDQLWKRLGKSPHQRLQVLRRHARLVERRDDLSVELCALYNQTGRPEKALALVSNRRFQPWEGGEGLALGQHVRTHLALGRRCLKRRDPPGAVAHFEAALGAPVNLGEAKHVLANQSDIHFWLGCAHESLGDSVNARKYWIMAAEFRGDFQGMSVRPFSEMTYYSVLALQNLGRLKEARALLDGLSRHAARLAREPATIDYFATSLPTMLLFEDDLTARQRTTALFLQAQVLLARRKKHAARKVLHQVLHRDPSHPLAGDLLSSTGDR